MRNTNIIYKINKGSVEELGKLYLKLKPEFVKLALKNHTISIDDAADIFTDALFAFRENIVKSSLKELDVNVKTYIFKIGFNMIAKQIQDNSKYDNSNIAEIEDEDLNNLSDDRLDIIAEILKNQITERCSKLIKLFYFDQRSYDQIQAWMEFSTKNSVKSQKSKCISKIKKLLQIIKKNGKS